MRPVSHSAQSALLYRFLQQTSSAGAVQDAALKSRASAHAASGYVTLPSTTGLL